MEKSKLTTVKILNEWYKRFKIQSFESEFTLQKLVNRCVHLFVTNEEFRDSILKHEIDDSSKKY